MGPGWCPVREAAVAVGIKGVVAGAHGNAGIGRDPRIHAGGRLVQAHGAGRRQRAGAVQIVLAGLHHMRGARDLVARTQRSGGFGKARHVGHDTLGGREDAAQLAGIRINMDEFLARHRAFDDRIAFGGGFAHARAHGQHQVGLAQALSQGRRHAPAYVAGGVGMALVKAFQAAPGRAHGQLEAFREAGDLFDGGMGPARAAQQQEGTLGHIQQGRHARQVGRAGMAAAALVARHVGHGGAAPQRVFGQGQHHGAGPSAGGDGVGAGDELRDTVGAVDLGHPFGHLAEHASVVDLLEGFALVEIVAHLAHEQNHGRGVLESRVHADAGVGGARAAGHETDARLAGELAIGFGHIGRAAFLAADDGLDGVLVFIQGIDAGQITLAGDHENAARAVNAQLLHQDLAAVAFDECLAHACTPWAALAHCSNSAWRASRRRAVL